MKKPSVQASVIASLLTVTAQSWALTPIERGRTECEPHPPVVTGPPARTTPPCGRFWSGEQRRTQTTMGEAAPSIVMQIPVT